MNVRLGLAGCQAGLEALSLSEAMQTIDDAEKAGLDGVWVNEEHLGGHGPKRPCWATVPFLAFVAGRVPRIRLGSAALLLPLHHPLRLAEEIGSLCSFAPGRVDLGVAPHRPGPYSESFGAPVHDSPDGFRRDFDDYLWAVQALLRGEEIDLQTSGHTGRGASSMIVPGVGPRWYRAAYSPASVSAAARAGMPLLQHYIQSPDSILAGRQAYREAAGAAATDLLVESPVHRFVLIASDQGDAERAARRFAVKLTDRLRSFGIDRRGYITEAKDLEPNRFVSETAIVGTPEVVFQRIMALAQQTGSATINLNLGWMGAVDHDQVASSAAHLIADLLPRIRQQTEFRVEQGRQNV